ncbi:MULTISPECIES: cupin domain-containing protein [unclassified Pseudomonas]|uniref:cupin domain-containing protein n=1 Tax=unclassified Pseudomonas TaxID=196821 RepID=UPI000D3C6E47|nr:MULTISPECIES: cupin domain-containing protein [unclassified Pseudomonas]RAU40348.1 cupin domain-containing protein [Pseudomonas sp. RIT 409]RAU55495.1 cupin domain-containing protein [Pseudomonas sp. RIT 412]
MPAPLFPESFDLHRSFEALSEHWSPKVVARINDQYVKVAKVLGQLVWHDHETQDELFYVVKGHLKIEYEGGRTVELPAGSMHVVPRGVLHNPVAEEECWIVLIEPADTLHTGTAVSPLSKTVEQQLS